MHRSALEYWDTLKLNGNRCHQAYTISFPCTGQLKHGYNLCMQDLLQLGLQAFLAKYFLPNKIAQLRNQITSFAQKDNESVYDAGDRFKELLILSPTMVQRNV